VHSLWVTSFYGTFLFDLHWRILFISISIILTNLDTLITLYFYVFKWNNKINKMKIIDAINKTFLQITQVMEVARALTMILMENDERFGYQCNLLYFLKWLSVKIIHFVNVMDIVSQLKDKGLPITIPFCMTKSLLLIYNKIHFNLFYCVIHCSCEMLHHWLNIWMIKYYNEEMWNLII